MNKEIGNLAIIQARMGSSRLPKKVMMNLIDKPVLEHVVNRVCRSENTDMVVIATTISKEDDAICDLAKKIGVTAFRGSENDVLDRYYQVAKLFLPQNIIRVTADCPLIDPDVIDRVITAHLDGNFDYTSNTIEETYPDGLDVEVMKYGALEDAWRNAKMASQREHVTQYIIHNDEFKKHSIRSDTYLGDKRWTLDTPKDYEFLKRVYEELNCREGNFSTADVLELLNRKPEIECINSDSMRNEGLKKSLENDYEI